MRWITIALPMLLVGCSHGHTVQESESIRDLTQTPEGRAFVETRCAQTLAPDKAALYASIMKVPEDEAARESCRRIVAAIAAGRLTPEQLTSLANRTASSQTQLELLRELLAPPDLG